MDARAHEPGGAEPLRLVGVAVPPRWRLPLLVLGFVSLAFGIAGGLYRSTPWFPVPGTAIALHGALMVSAFFGTVISLERAAAIDRPWAYAAPLCAGASGVVLLLGQGIVGFALMALAAALFLATSIVVVQRQRSLETATLLAGAAAWLAGNLMMFYGQAAVPWWIAFFALTFVGFVFSMVFGHAPVILPAVLRVRFPYRLGAPRARP